MQTELYRLAERIRGCRLCVEAPIGKPLPHEPRPILVQSATAKILIASQAPGTKAHASGIPFDDASGDRLRDWLGVSRETFYARDNFIIAPMGFCFPGQARTWPGAICRHGVNARRRGGRNCWRRCRKSIWF